MHLDLQAALDKIRKFLAVSRGDRVVVPQDHFAAESREIFGKKRWSQSGEFIEQTSQRPDINPSVIFLIVPYLRTGVVGRTRLGGGVLAF